MCSVVYFCYYSAHLPVKDFVVWSDYITVQVKPTFWDFSRKIQKKLVTHFWNTSNERNSKVKKRNYPQNIRLSPEPKGQNLKNILGPKNGLKTAKITLFFSNIFFTDFFAGLGAIYDQTKFFWFYQNHIVRIGNLIAVALVYSFLKKKFK